MDEQLGDIRMETQNLDRLIRGALVAQRRTALCNGDWTCLLRTFDDATIPEALIVDPLLEPVDKIVWQVLERHARAHGDHASLPRYQQLAACANVTNRKTISRAMTVLRCTRWLTICARYGTPVQYGHENIFALHARPLPLADTLFLDPGYVDFLRRSKGHARKFVRGVARRVLREIQPRQKS